MLARWRDLVPSLILVAFILAAFAVTSTFRDVPAAFAQGMQASAMPRLLLVCMAVLTGLMLIQGFGKPETAGLTVPWQVWATKAVMVVAALGFTTIGVTVTTALVLLVIPLLWGERRWALLVPYALLVPAAIYLVFTLLLQLRLPQGPLSGLL